MLKKQHKYLIQRFFESLLTVFMLLTLVFFLFRLLPGDPLSIYLDGSLPPESLEAIRKDFGLDQPLLIQYGVYLKNTLSGKLGQSFHYRVPVSGIIQRTFWPTMLLMGSSMVLAFIFGTLLGACLAWWRDTSFEWFGLVGALTLRSLPEFGVGVLFLVVFSYIFGWFPAGGMRSIGTEVIGFWDQYFSLDFLKHLFLPLMVSMLTYMAMPMLIMRNAMLETLGEDYLDLARAKGLKETGILFKYAMRNALLPTITVFSLMVAFAVGGQVVIETIFRWPGMGRELVLAIQRRDYPVLQAIFMILGILVIVFNLLTDVMYALLDPRVSVERRASEFSQ